MLSRQTRTFHRSRPTNQRSQKPISYFLLTVFSLLLFAPSVSSQEKSQPDDRAMKIRKSVFRVGADPRKEVTVKMKDQTVIRGFISEVTEDQFVVKSWNSGASTTLNYDQVKKIKFRNISPVGIDFRTPTSIYKRAVLGLAIGIGVVALVCVASGKCVD